MGFFDRFSKKKNEDKKGKEGVKKTAAVKEPVSALKAKETSTLKPKIETAAQEVKDFKSKKVKKEDTGFAYKILLKPLITEKATTLVSLNKYAFKVANNANKIEVKKAIKSLYGFEPVGVNISTERGKRITYGRIRGKKSNWKKAVITLKAGDKLEIYEGV